MCKRLSLVSRLEYGREFRRDHTMLSSPFLGARLIIAGLLLGSVASCGAAATETCTPVSPAGFKSRVIPQFYTSDQANCLNKYGPLNPNGKRPACAVTSWNSATHLCS